ncbi:MAG: TerC family protein, partial [Thermus sp.]
MEAGVLSLILILVALEVILSADNALILGVIVQKLPVHLRRKALFYG